LVIKLISLNADIKITAALFNESIIPHLQAAHPNLSVLNPAKIAAPAFVKALDTALAHTLKYALPKVIPYRRKNFADNFIEWLVVLFIGIIIFSVTYFHISENISWIDSLYFVVVTIATVGYGDISLLHSSIVTKLVGISLILSSTVFIWMVFSLTIDRVVKKRAQLLLGRKKYNYSDHIILCGLGRLGYFIAQELINRNEKVIIIESNENSPHIEYFRSEGLDVYIGNARLPKILEDVRVSNAKALISAISDDYMNIEIGLIARSYNNDVRLILRIFDEGMAHKIKDNLDIHLTLSMSAIADEKFLETLR
jgi:voltage-gated potassium channel Kch